MEPGEERGVIDLVSTVFNEYVAPLYSPEGVSEFMKYLREDELAHRIHSGNFVLLAKSGVDIIGVVEVRDNSHIAMLFVKGSHQKLGIGKELLKIAIEKCKTLNPDTRCITVNSFPNAVSAYRTMGFNARKPEQAVNGIRFTPMELSLILS
ncbi:MAG: GNAT family N-acetyltransferase [Deltaproteobacteria bacterium]|jgi:GNAT superfamily N-acetyltransferase|nr:GNAT family N-acetyltransferase [Deltaproteobacteria bacterium]